MNYVVHCRKNVLYEAKNFVQLKTKLIYDKDIKDFNFGGFQ